MTEASRRRLRAVPFDAPAASGRTALGTLDPRPTVVAVAARNLMLLFVAGVLGGVGGLVLSQLQTPKWSATGRIFLVDPNRDFGLDPDKAPWTDPLRYTRTRAQLVASGPVFRRVARALRTTPEDVADRVDVLPSREADVVTITGVAETEPAAERLVSLMQRHYEAVTTSAHQAPYRRALEQISDDRATLLADLRRVNARLAASPESTPLLAERSLLQDHYRFLRDREATLAANAGVLGGGVQLAETPVGSDAPISPRPMRNAAMGGLLLSVLVLTALWRSAGRAPTAGTHDLVEQVLGAPLLVELPPPGVRRDDRGVVDAFDELANAAVSASGAQVVLVSPVREADRRTQIPLRLAAALADGGKRVVVIDASDGGALTDASGGRDEPGLSEIGDDDARAVKLLRNVELATGSSVPVLGAGRRQRVPDRAARYERAIAELLNAFDIAIVDAPPARSLATVVSSGMRRVGIVVATPETELGAIADLRRDLVLLRVPALGFVFVRGRLGGEPRLRAVTNEPSSRAKVRAAAGRLRRWRP